MLRVLKRLALSTIVASAAVLTSAAFVAVDVTSVSAWSVDQSVTSRCGKGGTSEIEMAFNNREDNTAATSMEVTPMIGTYSVGNTKTVPGGSGISWFYDFGFDDLLAGVVTFHITWTDGHPGSDDSHYAVFGATGKCGSTDSVPTDDTVPPATDVPTTVDDTVPPATTDTSTTIVFDTLTPPVKVIFTSFECDAFTVVNKSTVALSVGILFSNPFEANGVMNLAPDTKQTVLIKVGQTVTLDITDSSIAHTYGPKSATGKNCTIPPNPPPTLPTATPTASTLPATGTPHTKYKVITPVVLLCLGLGCMFVSRRRTKVS